MNYAHCTIGVFHIGGGGKHFPLLVILTNPDARENELTRR